ncbi:MAG: sugar transferase [Bacteroidaceae bacterium]|nr:sugar transferase [Bacteroidaceae bacterium]
MRKLYKGNKGKQNPNRNFLLIGTDDEVAKLRAELDGQGISPQIQSVLPDAFSDSLHELENVVAVYCASGAVKSIDLSVLSRFCQENKAELYFCIPELAVFQKNMHVENVGFLSFLSPLDEPLSHWWNRMTKRLFDLLLSGFFLTFLFPFIYIFAAVIIKHRSAGPVFSVVRKAGLGGKSFGQLSFRTDGLPVESILKKTVLQFSPQLLNVFFGSMSVVGIVAKTTDEEQTFSEYMKPGLVKCQFCKNADVWYTQNWSLWLDIKIIVKMLLNKNKIV